MSDNLLYALLLLTMAIGISIFVRLLTDHRQQINATITGLIQQAENAVQGSKMGQARKAAVMAQLEAMGIKADVWVDETIDAIVAELNDKKGWLTIKATQGIGEALK